MSAWTCRSSDGKAAAKLDATYPFKHALVKDAVYGRSLRSHRQQSP